MQTPLFGIDLGGTKIEGIVLQSAANPTVLARQRIETQSEGGYLHILMRITDLVRQLEQTAGVKAQYVGIGTPGTIDPTTQLLKNSNTVCLNGQPFRRDLEAMLGVPLRCANDANCFAVAEANMGSVPDALPQGAEVVFGVIMGTGVGGGVVVNGKVLNGRHGIGGEWGHNVLDASGGDCYCGKVGCVERILSGTGLERFYAETAGEKRRLPDILSRVSFDAHALATQTRMIHFFGKAIANIINVLDPDAIVLGGGVGNVDLLYTDGVAEARKHIFNPILETVFLRPKLGDSAGVFGAALL